MGREQEAHRNQTGSIFQINISNGGVPKQAVRQAYLTTLGLTGDWQSDQEHHGGPGRAVCLYSLEHILALQAEGHPLFPGALGENITLHGINWSEITPGQQIYLGEQVVLEITSYTAPCLTIADSFLAGEYSRISQKANPGWSRVYAQVLAEGEIHVGERAWIKNK
jgi:MOSC domain-containing protein YiiM